MKNKQLIALAILILSSSFSFGQEFAIKDFDLRNYVAPDIKYQKFELGTNLSVSGFSEKNEHNYNNFNFNLRLAYSEYRSSAKIQSISYADIYGAYSGSWGESNDDKTKSISSEVRLDYYTQTRLYNSNKAFLGLYGSISYDYSPTNTDGYDNYIYKHTSNYFKFTPYISGGKGRIEPIESAREAMDILLSLEKYDRLSKTPDSKMIDSLSRVANRIKYKRFYDLRFKRIYQLEELDKALQGMDMVDRTDMVYFANLSDIWDYAPNYTRGSGLRFEGGVIPVYQVGKFKYEIDDVAGENITKTNGFGAYGFIAFNRNRPINYAWQNDLKLDLTFGYQSSTEKDIRPDVDDEITENEAIKGLLNMAWEFGLYPNTRTFASIAPYIATSYIDNEEDKFGISTGLRFRSYYYISPKVRLSLTAGLFYVDNFQSDVPSPFWNKIYSDRVRYAQNTLFSYDLMFTFNYAIF